MFTFCVAMKLLAYFLLFARLALADAMPYTTVDGSANGPLQERDDINATYSGEPPTARTGYVVVSLFCMMVLSLLLGMLYTCIYSREAIADCCDRGTI